MAAAWHPDRWHSAIVESSDDAIIGETLDGTILSWNPGAERVYGYGADEVVGRSVAVLLPPGRRDELPELLARIGRGERIDHFRTVRRTKDGQLIDVSMTVSPVRDESGTVLGASVVARDVSGEVEASHRLAEHARVARFASEVGRAFTEGGPLTATLRRCTDALVTHVGAALAQIWTTDDDVSRLTLRASSGSMAGRRGEPAGAAAPVVQRRPLAVAGRLVGMLIVVPRSGDPPTDTVVEALTSVADEIAIGIDRRHGEEAMAHRALHDPLTGLPNRMLLADRIEQAFAAAARDGRRVALLFVDLDGFKSVNDLEGHAAGDAVLSEVASRLRHVTRPADTVARFGGDEFVVVTEDAPDGAAGDGAVDIARRVLQVLERPFAVGGRPVAVSASIGLAVGTDHRDVDSLLADADAAMYRAKELGGGRVERFGAAVRRVGDDSPAGSEELRRALDERRLAVWYQPVVSLASGRMVGGEALLRWIHPEHGPVAAGQFVRRAEEIGLMPAFGRFVVARVCEDLCRWAGAAAAAGPGARGSAPVSVSVNLSAEELADDATVAFVASRARSGPVAPGALTVEVSEAAVAGDPVRALRNLQTLRRAGIQVAVDGFGAGVSSLTRLRRIPVDVVKLDRSVVRGLGRDPVDAALVEAVARLGRALPAAVAAQGVEDAGQLEAVRRLGCDTAQGRLIAPPLPAPEFSELLVSGRRW